MNRANFQRISEGLACFSDADFCAQAMADYLQDCSEKMEDLISACEEAVQTVDLDEDQYDDPSEVPTIEQVTQDIINRYNLNKNAKIGLTDGYTNVHDLVYSMIHQGNIIADPDEASLYPDDSRYSAPSIGLELKDINETINGVKLSIADVATELTNSLHATWVAKSAMLASKEKDVANRLTVFTQSISDKFKDVYTDISNSYSYYKSVLSNKAAEAKDVINSFIEAIGAITFADDDGHIPDNYTIGKTDISQFTGTSPMDAISLKSGMENIGQVTKTVMKAAGTILGGIVKGIWNVAKPLFQKASNIIQAVTVDPFDLAVEYPSNDVYSIDGYYHQQHCIASYFIERSGANYDYASIASDIQAASNNFFYNDDDAYNKWSNDIESRINKWFKFKFLCGEILFRITAAYIWDYDNNLPYPLTSWAAHTQNTQMFIEYDCLFKPYPCKGNDFILAAKAADPNVNIVHPNGDLHRFAFQWSTNHGLMDTLKYLQANGCFSVPEFDQSSGKEKETYAAYLNGMKLLRSIFTNVNTILANYIRDQQTEIYFNTSVEVYDECDGTGQNGAVTNLDFLKTAFSTRKDVVTSGSITYDTSGFNHAIFDDIGSFIYNMISVQMLDRIIYPTSYVFLPYRNNVASFDSSKVRIKTDDENAEVLSTFIAAAIIVIIVATIAITVTVKLKKYKRQRLFKKMDFVGKMDNQMWSTNTPLTNKEMRKYVRYKNKIDNSSFFNSAMVTSAASSLPDASINNGSDVAAIRKLLNASIN